MIGRPGVKAPVASYIMAGLILSTIACRGRAAVPDRDVIPPQAVSDAWTGNDVRSASDFIGVLLASDEVDVTVRVEGVVDSMSVGTGQLVEKSTILARIESDGALTNDLDIAIAETAISSAEARKADLDLAAVSERQDRMEALHSRGLISTQDLEQVRYEVRIAQLRLHNARMIVAQKNVIEDQRRVIASHSNVIAPIRGLVSTVYVGRGAHVSRGSRLVRLLGLGPLRLRFAVPVDLAPDVYVGRHVTGLVSELGRTVSGEVMRIMPEIDPVARLLVVEASIDEPGVVIPEALMLTGRSVRVKLAHDEDRRNAR